MGTVWVISLGGSIVAPDRVDSAFVKGFRDRITRHLNGDRSLRFILVVGGGGLARAYQHAFREVVEDGSDEAADWIGVAATRLNGQLLAATFAQHCLDPVTIDPTGEVRFNGRVLVAAGWKPGFSTDYDAVLLAEKFEADTIVNLSNIPQVYTNDPKIDASAQPIEAMDWKSFRNLVGDRWQPGKNAPFDPIASKKAAELGLRVIVAAGHELENLSAILTGRPFHGTVIGPG